MLRRHIVTADDAISLQQKLILAPRDHEHLSPRRPWSETAKSWTVPELATSYIWYIWMFISDPVVSGSLQPNLIFYLPWGLFSRQRLLVSTFPSCTSRCERWLGLAGMKSWGSVRWAVEGLGGILVDSPVIVFCQNKLAIEFMIISIKGKWW